MNLHMAASDFEIDKMKQMIKSDIELYGAVGISFGIEYSPGISFDEVVKISEGLGDGIILSGHYRKDSDNALESIKELVDINLEDPDELLYLLLTYKLLDSDADEKITE